MYSLSSNSSHLYVYSYTQEHLHLIMLHNSFMISVDDGCNLNYFLFNLVRAVVNIACQRNK